MPFSDESDTVSPASEVSEKSGAGDPSSSGKRASVHKAVAVVRVSRMGARDGESFVSPSEQTERIRQLAERDGLTLIDTIEELDVSGGTALAKRAGLRLAVEMVCPVENALHLRPCLGPQQPGLDATAERLETA